MPFFVTHLKMEDSEWKSSKSNDDIPFEPQAKPKEKVPDIIATHYGFPDLCPACEADDIEPGKRMCWSCNDKVRARICTVCNDPISKPGKHNARADTLGRCINCSGLNYCKNCGHSPVESRSSMCDDCKVEYYGG